VARAERSFGQMLDAVRRVAESFVGRFRDLAFGVSLSAGADVVIAGTATAANFSVTLTWHRSVRIGGGRRHARRSRRSRRARPGADVCHVVSDALEQPREAPVAEGTTVRVGFPLVEASGRAERQAVVAWVER
jgi:hypothetical protein